jgi:uncharacterized DUF497 family protein
MSNPDDYSDGEFEWGLVKAAVNSKDHRVTFEHAKKVFQDRFAVEYIDDREDYGEERINRVGMCDGKLHFVTYTERGEKRRLISAREAEKDERDDYYEQNAV